MNANAYNLVRLAAARTHSQVFRPRCWAGILPTCPRLGNRREVDNAIDALHGGLPLGEVGEGSARNDLPPAHLQDRAARCRKGAATA